jgi:hypothetical protein
VLILDMIEVLPPLRKYKYDTWRILLVKCYIDNSVRLRSYIRNVNSIIENPPIDLEATDPSFLRWFCHNEQPLRVLYHGWGNAIHDV